MSRLPGTTWIGQGNPILGGADAAPRYSPPFNMNLGSGPFSQMGTALGTMALQQFMAGTGRNPYQFVPTQGMYDQIVARRFFEDQQQAMTLATRRDQARLADIINGGYRLWEGRELTPLELTRNANISRQFSSYLPMAIQFFGPDAVDQAFGARGSNVVMTQQLHSALRTAVDPMTGRIGMSGAGAASLSSEVYSRLFGPNANLAAMRGMSAGQAGTLANELQSRGMLGSLGQLGPNTMADLRSRGTGFFDDAFVARAADRDASIQTILARGDTPTAADYEGARNRIRETRGRVLSAGSGGLDTEGLSRLAGGEDMLRAVDAHAISQRLESLSGVVSAMREIFGDMGNPNAPMHEIINGLQNLTQGGLAHLSPSALEGMVRRTQVMARQTGMGMQGAIALSSQVAGFGDQLGMNRLLVPGITANAGFYGAAARATQRFDMPMWNAPSLDEVILGDARLQTLGASSPLGNNLNAMLSMANQGIIPAIAPGASPTQSQAIVAAINAGAREFTWGGQTRSLQMSRDQLRQLVTGEHGASDAAVRAIFNDRMGNQRFGEQTITSIRGVQGFDAARMLGGAYAGPLSQALIASGAMSSPNQARDFADALGRGLATDFLDSPEMSADVRRDETRFRAARVASMRNRIRQQVIASGTPAAQVDARTEQIIAGMGDLGAMHGALTASANTATAGTLFRSEEGVANMTGIRTLTEMRRQAGRAASQSIIASSLSGLGTAPFGARLIDAIAGAQPGQDIRGTIADVLGGISDSQLAATDPHGIVSALSELVGISGGLNANNPADRVLLDRNAALQRGLTMGGHEAQQVLEQYRYDPSISGSTMAALEAAATGRGAASILSAAPTAPDPKHVADDLIAAMPHEQQRKFGYDQPNSRLKLITEIRRGARGGAIATALRSQDRLVNFALARGLYGEGTTADELTPTQRLQAGGLLQQQRGSFTAQETRDFDLWMRQAQPLQTLGRGGTSQAVEDAVRVIRGFSSTAAPPGGAPGGSGGQITHWTGDFTIIGDRAIVNARPADIVTALAPG